MKKLLTCFVIILAIVFAGDAMAADAMTVTMEDHPLENLRVVKVTWTDSPALTPESQSSGANVFTNGWYLFKAQTIPGTAAAQPDDNYNITITDAEGVDLMGGELANRDDTNAEEAVPKIDGVYGPQPVISALTVTVTGQTNTSGTGELYLFFAKY